MSTLLCLPDEVLIHICGFLTLMDWLSLEQVSHRLNAMLSAIWASRKSVDLCSLLGVTPVRFCRDILNNRVFIHADNILSLASKCGGHLEELSCGNGRMKMVASSVRLFSASPDYFPHLRTLDLSNCLLMPATDWVEKSIPENLEQSNISVLNLRSCFDESSLNYYTEFTGCPDEELFKLLSAMPNLAELKLAECTALLGSGLFGLSPSLTVLDLSFCRRISADVLSNVFATLPNLTAVSLYSNNKITGSCLLQLPAGLAKVDLSYCDAITSSELSDFLSSHKDLRELVLSHLNCLNNDALAKLADLALVDVLVMQAYYRDAYYDSQIHIHDISLGMESIRHLNGLRISNVRDILFHWNCLLIRLLDLSNNDFVTDAVLDKITNGCRQIKELALCCVVNVSAAGFLCLAANLSLLEVLDVSANATITVDCLTAIGQANPQLKQVNARNCRQITFVDIKSMGVYWPDIPTIFQIY